MATPAPSTPPGGGGGGSPPPGKADTIIQLQVVVVVFEVLALAAIAARFVARRMTRNAVGSDDLLIVVAGIISVVNMAVDLVLINFGQGRQTSIGPQDIQAFLRVVFVGQIIYAPVIVAIKMSVLCLYMRLFSPNRAFRVAVYCFGAATLAWGTAYFFGTIFQCTPVSAQWDKTVPASCIDFRAFLLGENIPDVLIDLGVLILPMPIVWGLKMPVSKKIAVMAIFMLAAFDTAMAVLRLATLDHFDPNDATLGFRNPMIWSTVEIDIGIVCACLPVMAPIFQKIFGRWISSWSSRGGTRSRPEGANTAGTPGVGHMGGGGSKSTHGLSVKSITSPNHFHRLNEDDEGAMELVPNKASNRGYQ